MIQTKDLRIGNLVHDFFSDKPIVVEGISKSDTSFDAYYIEHNNGSKTTIKDFDDEYYITGISLSEEWLDKLNFDNNDTNHYIEHDGKKFYIYRRTSPGSYVWIAEIKYVHQLQNIYYFLTNGKELEFIPPTSAELIK